MREKEREREREETEVESEKEQEKSNLAWTDIAIVSDYKRIQISHIPAYPSVPSTEVTRRGQRCVAGDLGP
jgi:hypothetical protein